MPKLKKVKIPKLYNVLENEPIPATGEKNITSAFMERLMPRKLISGFYAMWSSVEQPPVSYRREFHANVGYALPKSTGIDGKGIRFSKTKRMHKIATK